MPLRFDDERVDRLIDEVARGMTAIEPRDLSSAIRHRIVTAHHGAGSWLVPAFAALVIIAAAALGIYTTRTGHSVDVAGGARVEAPITNANDPQPPRTASSDTRHVERTRNGASPATAVRSARSYVARRRGAILPDIPPFVSDVAPAPLGVKPVTVAPLDSPAMPDVPELDVAPLTIPPAGDKGGSK